MTYTLNNEVVNFLVSGARADIAYYSNTKVSSTFVLDSVTLLSVTVNVYYQRKGDLIKSYFIDLADISPVGGTFLWTIEKGDLDLKPMNYYWEAIDDQDECIAYGNFEVI
jgi:hypothetical protein